MTMRLRIASCLLLSFALAAALPPRDARTQETSPEAVSADSVDYRVAQTMLVKARVAAGDDEHKRAVRYYRKAIELHPPLGADIGKELGLQYTWADMPDSAIQWFEVYLAHHPDDLDAHIGVARALAWSDRLSESREYYASIIDTIDADHDEARVGLARVTSWTDRLEEAERIYEDVLADHPDNFDARVGQAQVVNWSGRHRQAAFLYETILQDTPDNSEVRVGLAQAYQWMGRSDLALQTLSAAPESERPLQRLASEIQGARTPTASYSYNANQDSDDVERRINSFRAGFSPAILSRADGHFLFGKITQPETPEVRRTALELGWNQRFSTLLAASITAGYQWNQFDRFGPESFWLDEFNMLTLDSYATFTPRDWVRADFGIFRGPLDNPVPIFRGIFLTEYSGGLDYRFRQTMISVTAAAYADFSDGNRRFRASEELVWRPLYRIPMPVKHRFTSHTFLGYMGFRETKDHGYYNPLTYWTLYELVEVDFDFSARWRLNLNGRFGTEKENSLPWYGVGAFGGGISWSALQGLTLSAGYFNSRSRLDTRSGFQADGFYLTADYRF